MAFVVSGTERDAVSLGGQEFVRKPSDGLLLKQLNIPGTTITGKPRSVSVPDAENLTGKLMFLLNFNFQYGTDVFVTTQPLSNDFDYIYKVRCRPIIVSVQDLRNGLVLKPGDWIQEIKSGNSPIIYAPTGNNVTAQLIGSTLTFAPTGKSIFWISTDVNGWGLPFGYSSVFQVISE